ncbi:terminase small subunit [Snodgrassella gandavensis]|uniref:terminase small subunit n=1 Tax=Snodgrassella gandavensis TaxID=2946698 RepID=UPI001EF469F3|nr:terminase small subunit [Snodgrassella gandavensis]
MAMNEQKELFARAIAISGGRISNREAAIEAGYSEKTASATGSRLRKDPEVIALIEKLSAPMANSASQQGDDLAKAAVKVADTVPALQADSFYGEAIVQTGLQVAIGDKNYSLLDPRDLLTLAGMGVVTLTQSQIKSLQTVLPYKYGKVGETGKKEAQQAAAEEILQTDTFAPLRSPSIGRLQ